MANVHTWPKQGWVGYGLSRVWLERETGRFHGLGERVLQSYCSRRVGTTFGSFKVPTVSVLEVWGWGLFVVWGCVGLGTALSLAREFREAWLAHLPGSG